MQRFLSSAVRYSASSKTANVFSFLKHICHEMSSPSSYVLSKYESTQNALSLNINYRHSENKAKFASSTAAASTTNTAELVWSKM